MNFSLSTSTLFRSIFLIYLLSAIFQFYLTIAYEHEIVIDRISLTHLTKKGNRWIVRKNISLKAISQISSPAAGLFLMSHCVAIKSREMNYCFGRHLDFPEQRWIAHQIKQHLANIKSL